MRNLVARQPSATETDVTKVTVFDAENKLVAYSGTFKQGVREVFSQWGMVYVLSTDGKVRLLIYLISLRLISCNLARVLAREIDGGQARHAVPQIAVPPGPELGSDAEAR